MISIAIIPARGGSKRIPRKNLIDIDGIPMVGRAIQTAKESGLFEKVIVTTEDREIAAISVEYGACVPKLRSVELSDDFTNTNAVIKDCLQESWIGKLEPDYVCCLYPTTPLLEPKHLKESFEIIQKGNSNYVFPAIAYSHPIFRGFKLDAENSPTMLFPEYQAWRTQDLSQVYHDAGQFYWGTFKSWINNLQIIGPKSKAYVVEDNAFVDIDNYADLETVNLLLKLRRLQRQKIHSKN